MARVTVEDCILKVPNRFDLVLAAAQRARDIAAGAQITVERDNDKNPVVALREIADSSIQPDALREALIQGLQKHVEVDEPEEDTTDLLNIETDMQALAEQAAAEEADDVIEDGEESIPADEEAAPEGKPPAEEGA